MQKPNAYQLISKNRRKWPKKAEKSKKRHKTKTRSYSTEAMGTEVLVMRIAPGPLLCENVETAGNKHESQHLTNTSCLLPAEPRHLTLVAATTNISRVVTAIGSLKHWQIIVVRKLLVS